MLLYKNVVLIKIYIYLIFDVPLSSLYCEIYIWNLTKNETLQTIDWVLKKKQI